MFSLSRLTGGGLINKSGNYDPEGAQSSAKCFNDLAYCFKAFNSIFKVFIKV
jgi:hypothetical protein